MIQTTEAIERLIREGAIFYVSHSGGKDSQAMYALIRKVVPDDQIVVVHSDLGEVEWTGVQDHIRETVDHELNVVQATKTFFEMVERRFEKDPTRPCWPSSATRQCTSDLKRGPIYKFIRNDMKRRGVTKAVNVMGLRAEESSARAKKPEWNSNTLLSKAGREVYDWLPIHHLSTDQVFQAIEDAGQKPFWAYRENKRLSCVFCIMGCESDLRHGAEQRPELYRKYVELERRTGWTMFNGRSLEDRVGVPVPLTISAA